MIETVFASGSETPFPAFFETDKIGVAEIEATRPLADVPGNGSHIPDLRCPHLAGGLEKEGKFPPEDGSFQSTQRHCCPDRNPIRLLCDLLEFGDCPNIDQHFVEHHLAFSSSGPVSP